MATTAPNPARQNHPQFSDFPKPTHTVSHEHVSPYSHHHHEKVDAPSRYHRPHHASTDPTPLTHPHSHALPLPSRHTHSFPRPHIATPHPMTTALGYLDNHVPSFAKHHKEYTLQHNFRRAKRDARESLDSAIPEMVEEPNKLTGEEDIRLFEVQERARLEKEEQVCKDKEAWEAVVKEREAARRRSGSSFER